ncbi:MAG: class I SAM-dependent methyltransferase [Candidatus Omnitrophota bacterium]
MNPYRYSLTTRLKEDFLIKLMAPGAHDTILDLGCGLGYFMGIILSSGAKSFGLDFNFKSLSLAKKEVPGDYLLADAGSIPIKDDTFNKILFTDVIEHLENDGQAFTEISRVAKDGALVVISTVCMEGIFAGSRLNLLFHDKPGSPEYHFRPGYKTEDLIKLMEKHNIACTDVKYTTVLLGEIFIEMLKLFYSRLKKDFHTQADASGEEKSFLFTIYRKLIFPVLFGISKLEGLLLSMHLKGHVVMVKGIVNKSGVHSDVRP